MHCKQLYWQALTNMLGPDFLLWLKWPTKQRCWLCSSAQKRLYKMLPELSGMTCRYSSGYTTSVSPTPIVGMVKGKLLRGQSWVTWAKVGKRSIKKKDSLNHWLMNIGLNVKVTNLTIIPSWGSVISLSLLTFSLPGLWALFSRNSGDIKVNNGHLFN